MSDAAASPRPAPAPETELLEEVQAFSREIVDVREGYRKLKQDVLTALGVSDPWAVTTWTRKQICDAIEATRRPARETFNRKSEQMGFPERIGAPPAAGADAGDVTDADVRRAVDVFEDEGGERGDTTLPDDLLAVLRDFAARRGIVTTPATRVAPSWGSQTYTPQPVKRILRNMAQCRECGAVIESKHRHDYVTCSCGAIAVDGGKDYIRRGINRPSPYVLIEMSIYEESSTPTDSGAANG